MSPLPFLSLVDAPERKQERGPRRDGGGNRARSRLVAVADLR